MRPCWGDEQITLGFGCFLGIWNLGNLEQEQEVTRPLSVTWLWLLFGQSGTELQSKPEGCWGFSGSKVLRIGKD